MREHWTCLTAPADIPRGNSPTAAATTKGWGFSARK